MTALRTPNAASSLRYLQLFLSNRPVPAGVHAASGPREDDDFDGPEDLDVEERPFSRRR